MGVVIVVVRCMIIGRCSTCYAKLPLDLRQPIFFGEEQQRTDRDNDCQVGDRVSSGLFCWRRLVHNYAIELNWPKL